MCTIMLYPETLPAEKRSRRDSQIAVDELIAFDRKLADEPEEKTPMKAPFADLFRFDCPKKVYVWLDNCCFGNSDKKGFYYVRYQLSMLAGGSTAYAHPVLIVQKNKLRPDQIEYMERKCAETLQAAREAREK